MTSFDEHQLVKFSFLKAKTEKQMNKRLFVPVSFCFWFRLESVCMCLCECMHMHAGVFACVHVCHVQVFIMCLCMSVQMLYVSAHICLFCSVCLSVPMYGLSVYIWVEEGGGVNSVSCMCTCINFKYYYQVPHI